jgi:lysophospholipase L1-like esterase
MLRRFRFFVFFVFFVMSMFGVAAGCGQEARQEGRPAAPASPAIASARSSAESAISGAARPGATSLEIRYLALGDSFTIGTGATPEESFPARLSARFRERKRQVTLKNLAVNGYSTSDVLALQIPNTRAFEPSLVTFAAGANDIVRGSSPERYRENVRRIFERLLEAGVPATSIYALPQPDWSLSSAASEFGTPVAELARQIELFNSILREETARAGAHYIDLWPRMKEQARAGMFAPDGLHPSAKAYDEWAALLADRIKLPEAASGH